MRLRTLDDLVTPDKRTLHFTPWGFAGGTLQPEVAADFQQGAIAASDLAYDVPDSTRDAFERLRALHSYGVLWYDAFTVVTDLQWVVMEQALRERFVAFYDGAIPLVRKVDGGEQAEDLSVTSVDTVFESFRPGGAYSKDRWRLRLRSSGDAVRVPLYLGELLRWARRERLLYGQRNKWVEPVYRSLRNRAIHPSGHTIRMPPDSALAIRDLGEIINRLWGVLTPGGRLYPAPIDREVRVIAWAQGGRVRAYPRADQLGLLEKDKAWECIVVRAAVADDDWSDFDARYEMRALPCDLLWGPGTPAAADAWLQTERPGGDTVEYLDRLFALRICDGRVSLPRRPEVMMALCGAARHGDWHVIRADYPNDALAHVRHVKDGRTCQDEGREYGCAVEVVAHGDWSSVTDSLRDLGIRPLPEEPRAVKVPRCFPLASDLDDT